MNAPTNHVPTNPQHVHTPISDDERPPSRLFMRLWGPVWARAWAEVCFSCSLIASRWSFPSQIRLLSSSPLVRRFCLTSHTRLLAAEWLWRGLWCPDPAHVALLHTPPHAFYILYASFGGRDIHNMGV